MNGPVHLWTRPSDQGEPFGAYGQAVDNTAVLPTACPHSRPSRPQDTQAQNALRLYNAMKGLRESRQGDRATQRTNTKQGQASPKELGGKTLTDKVWRNTTQKRKNQCPGFNWSQRKGVPHV